MDARGICDPVFKNFVLPNAAFQGRVVVLADRCQVRHLGEAKVERTVSDVAFGGRNRSRLFTGASYSLCAIVVDMRGAART